MSVADTAITFGSAPGNSSGDFGPALPAAAIRMTPRSFRPLIACSRIGSRGPAKLILMICAPSFTAHSSPLTMFMLVPCAPPVFTPKARTASMRAPGATPSRRWCDAIAPAMPVPCGCAVLSSEGSAS